MTYWLYDPKKLASSSTLIPYKQNNVGEVFNFLTVLCMFAYIYLFKTQQIEKHGKNLFVTFLSILLLGVFLGMPKKNFSLNEDFSSFSEYQNSLFID